MVQCNLRPRAEGDLERTFQMQFVPYALLWFQICSKFIDIEVIAYHLISAIWEDQFIISR